MEGSLQWNLMYSWKDFHLQWVLNMGHLDQQANFSPSEKITWYAPASFGMGRLTGYRFDCDVAHVM